MAWKVIKTDEASAWLNSLSDKDRAKIMAPIEALEQTGPTLGGGLSKRIRGSRHSNMKELRSVGGNLRMLYAFDKRRNAILLTGDDKTNNWERFYLTHVPRADRLMDEHNRGDEGGGPCREPRTGGRG